MSSMPRVGIVVPAFNAAAFLEETLVSVVRQTFVAWQCIVVDDGSSDTTRSVAEVFAARDNRIRVLGMKNCGPALARNKGEAELDQSVEHLVFMDADDLWDEDALRILVAHLDGSSGAVGAHAIGRFVDAAGRPLLPGVFEDIGRGRETGERGRIERLAPDEPSRFASVFTRSTIFPPGLVIVRRDAFRAVGGFDPAARWSEDWDLWIRVCRLGDMAFVDRPLLGYRRHDYNAGAGQNVARAAHMVRVRQFFSCDNSSDHRRIVRQCWMAIQRRAMAVRASEAKHALCRADARNAARHLAGATASAGRLLLGKPRSSASVWRHHGDVPGRGVGRR